MLTRESVPASIVRWSTVSFGSSFCWSRLGCLFSGPSASSLLISFAPLKKDDKHLDDSVFMREKILTNSILSWSSLVLRRSVTFSLFAWMLWYCYAMLAMWSGRGSGRFEPCILQLHHSKNWQEANHPKPLHENCRSHSSCQSPEYSSCFVLVYWCWQVANSELAGWGTIANLQSTVPISTSKVTLFSIWSAAHNVPPLFQVVDFGLSLTQCFLSSSCLFCKVWIHSYHMTSHKVPRPAFSLRTGSWLRLVETCRRSELAYLLLNSRELGVFLVSIKEEKMKASIGDSIRSSHGTFIRNLLLPMGLGENHHHQRMVA